MRVNQHNAVGGLLHQGVEACLAFLQRLRAGAGGSDVLQGYKHAVRRGFPCAGFRNGVEQHPDHVALRGVAYADDFVENRLAGAQRHQGRVVFGRDDAAIIGMNIPQGGVACGVQKLLAGHTKQAAGRRVNVVQGAVSQLVKHAL